MFLRLSMSHLVPRFKVGLALGTLDGNPNRYMAALAHPMPDAVQNLGALREIEQKYRDRAREEEKRGG